MKSNKIQCCLSERRLSHARVRLLLISNHPGNDSEGRYDGPLDNRLPMSTVINSDDEPYQAK